MFKFNKKMQKYIGLLFVLVGLIVISVLIVERGGDEFSLQTAIGQTNEPLRTLTGQDLEDFEYLERANRAFTGLVALTRPAVVKINTTTQVNNRQSREGMTPEQEDRFRRFFGDDFPFRRFFEFDGRPPRNVEPRATTGIGSGVIVSEDGYILTNNHVIEGVDEMNVVLADGREYAAELIGRDSAQTQAGGTDLAVLKIDAEGLPLLPFGDSDALEVGEWVIAIGTPLNYSQTVTRGIVSAKGRSGFTAYGELIQTDAPINRGNSGGALINIRGELVGINTAIATNGFVGGNIGIGFAIPSNLAGNLLPQLIKYGKIERGWLGILMEKVDADLAEKLNLDSPRGVLVDFVSKDGPARKGGIRRGDVILVFDGQEIEDLMHLKNVVAATEIGKPVEVVILRAGKKDKRLTVKLEKRTAEVVTNLTKEFEETKAPLGQADDGAEHAAQPELGFAGINVQELTSALAERYGYLPDEKGVLVTRVAEGSPAAKKGIRRGHLIQEVEYTTILNLEQYATVVKQIHENKEKYVILYVKSPNRGGARYITLNLNRDNR